jgi:YVTN family beta-propeller protein
LVHGVYGAVPISLNSLFRRRVIPVLAAAVLTALPFIVAGCGETYRPVANPITKPGGDPQATHYALVINSNGGQPQIPGNPLAVPPVPAGPAPSVTQIDVSGDTNIGNFVAGLNPVHAVLSPAFGLAYIVNQGDNTLTVYSPNSGVGATISTIPLLMSNSEPNAGASFVAASTQLAFVVETSLNRVVIIDGAQLQARSFVPVGVNPVAVACTTDGRKAYVSNKGSNTVSVISTKDDTNQANLPVGNSPGPIAISLDNNYVFVANQGDGTISVIDTNSDTVTNTLPVGINPSQLVWDDNLKRVYAVNTGSGSVTIIDASAFPQKVLATVTTSANPVAVAPLDNGTKFYVLFVGTPGTVEVYDAHGYYKRGTVTVGSNVLPSGMPGLNQVLLAAAPGSTKVYAVNYNGDSVNTSGSTSIIRTLDDVVVLNIPSAAPHPTFVTSE